MKSSIVGLGILLAMAVTVDARAVTSAEIFTTDAYQYGRFSARLQFAPGSGVVSSFFLWKDGSEVEGTFWNELDFEKLEAVCRVETNTIYGNPVELHSGRHDIASDLCGAYHVYMYEWTPKYLSWTVDGVEIRRETGDVVQAYADNTASGMQLRFNVWPGDETFGGAFNPSILPVYQYIDWVEYASYANGSFEVQWRDDFTESTLPARWSTASWDSPKGLSTHAAVNVAIKDGYAVLALTADDATGTAGASPKTTDTQVDPGTTTMPEPSTGTSAPPATTYVDSTASTQEETITEGSSTASADAGSTATTATVNDGSSAVSTTESTDGETQSHTTVTSTGTTTSTAATQPAATVTNVTAPSSSNAGGTTPTQDHTSEPASEDASVQHAACGCRIGAAGAPHLRLVFVWAAVAALAGRIVSRSRRWRG